MDTAVHLGLELDALTTGSSVGGSPNNRATLTVAYSANWPGVPTTYHVTASPLHAWDMFVQQLKDAANLTPGHTIKCASGTVREVAAKINACPELAALGSASYRGKTLVTFSCHSGVGQPYTVGKLGRPVFLDRIEHRLSTGFMKLSYNQYLAFQPVKLSIYEKDGHYKMHKDEKAQDNHVATLFVVLPSEHTGGALQVKDDFGDEIVFDFAKHSADKTSVQWATFLPGCEYEFKPVESGRCVVFAYRVLVSDKPKKKKSNTSHNFGYRYNDGSSYPFEETETTAVKGGKLAGLQGLAGLVRGTMGFVLRHDYGAAVNEEGIKPEMLKGMDRTLYDYFQQSCKPGAAQQPRLYTVVALDRGTKVPSKAWYHEATIECDVYSLAPGELEYHAGMCSSDQEPAQPVDSDVKFMRGEWCEEYIKLASREASHSSSSASYDHAYIQTALVVSEDDVLDGLRRPSEEDDI